MQDMVNEILEGYVDKREHERRVEELLNANNGLLERARKAEGKIVEALDRAEELDPTDANALGKVVRVLKADPTEGQVFVEDGEKMACALLKVVDHFGGSIRDMKEGEDIADFVIGLASRAQ